MISPELQSKLALWRQRAAEGTITLEEMREAILLIRGDRRNAVTASETAKRSKARAAIPSADAMLGELKGI